MEYKIGKILKSQDGDTFVEIINGEDRCRISLEEVGEDYPTVKRKLSSIGVRLLTPISERRLREQLQNAVPSGACLSAKRPGWLSHNIYVQTGRLRRVKTKSDKFLLRLDLNRLLEKRDLTESGLRGLRPSTKPKSC